MTPLDKHSQDDICTVEVAGSLKALAHPVRLKMLKELQLSEMPCCGDICDCFPYSQSTVSQHLSVLVDSGLVECRQDGNKTRYSLNHAAYASLIDRLNQLVPISEKADH